MIADATLHLLGFNFTKLDMDKSRSFAVSTRDHRSVQEAVKLFEADLGRQVYAPAKSNLVVSPENAREMLTAFIKGAKKEGVKLAPFIGIGCPEKILEDGSIDRGTQNLPGNWESSRFNLPPRLQVGIPKTRLQQTVALTRQDP